MWIISYWLLPCISAAMWLGMLLAMLILWSAVYGSPVYPSMQSGQTIAYISDVGAYNLKPLFIAGCCVTVIFLDLGFISERWLRHTGRLAPNTSLTQKLLSVFAILFAIAGTCGLILLSIFDTYRHSRLHNVFLLIFIAGYVISAIFLCAEYQRLGIHYRNHRVLRASFWVKLAFILIEVVMAIVFIATSYTSHRNIAAIFEWIIAFIFTFYVLSFVIDLLPSVRTRNHIPQGQKAMTELEQGHHHAGHNSHRLSGSTAGANVNAPTMEYERPLTYDSTGPNNENARKGETMGYRGVS